jgi:hypothetical protein
MTTQTLYLREPKKHSVRYDASPTDVRPMLSSVYVSKEHLTAPYPTAITVTIEPVA